MEFVNKHNNIQKCLAGLIQTKVVITIDASLMAQRMTKVDGFEIKSYIRNGSTFSSLDHGCIVVK